MRKKEIISKRDGPLWKHIKPEKSNRQAYHNGVAFFLFFQETSGIPLIRQPLEASRDTGARGILYVILISFLFFLSLSPKFSGIQ